MARMEIAKWGNSLAVRIPKVLAQGAQLEEGMSVEVEVTPEGLLIRPVHRFTLEALLEGVTDENLHGEQEQDEPTGQEVW